MEEVVNAIIENEKQTRTDNLNKFQENFKNDVYFMVKYI